MVLLKAQRLQRLAEKLGRIESRLARASGEVEEAADELEEAAASAGVELEAARRLDAATLERALSPGGLPDPGRFWAVAEALYLDALRAEAEGEGPASVGRGLRKARRLFERAEEAGGLELPERAVPPAARLEEIAARLEGLTGPDEAGPEETNPDP